MNSRGAREIYPSLDEINKVRRKKSKGFSCRLTGDLQIKKVFTEITRDFPVEIANSSGFSGRKQVISKKRSSSQECHKIWCQSTKNTNLDLDLRSRSPKPVNFFEAQSSLGGSQFSCGGAQADSWGDTAPICPPVAPGLTKRGFVRSFQSELRYKLPQ